MRKTLITAKKTHRLGFIIILIAFNFPSFSQNDPVRLKRISGKIIFDSSPSEAAWHELDPFPLTMYKPDFGAEPSEKSDIRIG